MADKLLKLKKFEIVVVIDDSGSMDTRIKGKRCSRWDELREIVKTVVEIAIIFDTNGVDVHFLNSPEILKVKDARTIDRIFERTPCGFTPTVSTLTKIFKSNLAKEGRDKNLLVFVATDGEPTDDDGNDDFVRFEKVMKETRNQETTFVSFLLCTDVPKYADLFQHYDASMKNVDVVDDYETEKAQVRRRMGPNYPFEHGDYVVKALVGSILTDLDKIDDPLFSKRIYSKMSSNSRVKTAVTHAIYCLHHS